MASRSDPEPLSLRPLPENAHAHAGAHVEALGVLEVREKRLHEMAFFHRHDHYGRLYVGGGKLLEVVKRGPVAGLWFVGAVVPREGPGVSGGQGEV